MTTILVTRSIPLAALSAMGSQLPTARVDVCSDGLDSGEGLVKRARGADAIIGTLADTFDAATLKALAPRLKILANYAVGTNNIDLEAARALGIRVTNTPDVLTDATAEVAVGLMLAAARRFAEGDAITRAGRFTGWAPLYHLGHGIYGKRVGIIGAGRIGLRVARTMRHGFGCEISYASRSPKPEWDSELRATRQDLEALLAESDFVSLHCPLTPQTRHLIDARRLSLMKPTAVLVNTARGPVIDEAALVQALRDQRIFAAGLDVYEDEPSLNPGLAELPNVVLLPHIGSATVATREAMGRMCAQAVIDVLQGREPANAVV